MTFHEDFFANLPIGAYRTKVDGTIEQANQALAQMLGYPTVEILKEANSRYFYFDQEDRIRWQKALEASANNKLVNFETRWQRFRGGRPITVRNSARAIRLGGIVIAYEGVVIDIGSFPAQPTPLPVPEGPALSDLWSDAVKGILPICITRKTPNRKVVWANDTYCRNVGLPLEEILGAKNTDALIYGEELDRTYRASDEAVINSKRPIVATERHKSGDGKIRHVQVIKVPQFDNEGNFIGIEALFWDVEELEEVKIKVESMERQLQYTVVYEHDIDGNFTYVNKAAEELTGRKLSDWIGKSYLNFVAPEYHEFVKSMIRSKIDAATPSEAITCYEIDILGADGRNISVEVTSRLIIKSGRPAGVIGFVRDLTHRKEAERTRLREIHHRVKNNLHAIYSLLGSEKDQAESEQTRAALEGCRSRVLTIAQLHQQLYKSARVDQIDAGIYVRDLTEQLVKTYRRAWQEISTRVSVDGNIFLNLDILTPCALVLHELVSNTMKHGFPQKTDGGKRHGILFVTLSRTKGDHSYVLQVQDTGVGLPSGFTLQKAKSLGLRLVYGLVEEQLGGHVNCAASASGTSFTIEFNDSPPIPLN